MPDGDVDPGPAIRRECPEDDHFAEAGAVYLPGIAAEPGQDRLARHPHRGGLRWQPQRAVGAWRGSALEEDRPVRSVELPTAYQDRALVSLGGPQDLHRGVVATVPGRVADHPLGT